MGSNRLDKIWRLIILVYTDTPQVINVHMGKAERESMSKFKVIKQGHNMKASLLSFTLPSLMHCVSAGPTKVSAF